jgi:hypothetical protein
MNDTTAGVGYQSGSGGSVTQSTSKATGVTLNKPCGLVTMHNAALAANTTVRFTMTNSTVNIYDQVLVAVADTATQSSYQAWSEYSRSGTVDICLRNITAG